MNLNSWHATIHSLLLVCFFDLFFCNLTFQDKARKATGMQVDVMQDGYIDHELFSLSSIKVGFCFCSFSFFCMIVL